ncbi:hypothetical protein IFT48_17270 [Pseudomonas fluorescens]|uniref:hypothetical protein n=1 Tax=Pseudomonas fluorescens TaxID=294 RepID=UPI001906DE8C|nr:hypothetical protein [Pseudomonas fluorescens]MBD8091745.1 hypothetical protein [Pseudomonas fluorescens]MBD8716132.1 hypothetical protein [Pseudomonas fluorescens]
MNEQVLGSPCFVHKAGATAGLAGLVCEFGEPDWMLAHPSGSFLLKISTHHVPSRTLPMNKKPSNFKRDSIALMSKLPSEWVLAFLLGTLPILFFSSTQKDVDDIVQGLLAIGPLIKYSAYLVGPYAFVFLVKHGIRFGSDKSIDAFNFIHKIIAEIGTGFLTITRTGLGAVFGVLALGLTTDIITVNNQQIISLGIMILSLTLTNCALALGKDTLIERTNRPPVKNPIKLSPKLK